MKREDVYVKLNMVFRDVFDDDSLSVTDAATAEDIDDWDSLTHITLISEIEDAFEIQFEMKDITKMKDVGEMVDKIMELLNGRDL